MEMSYEDKDFKRFVSDNLFIGRGSFGDVYGPCDLDGKKCAVKKRWLTNATNEDTEKELSACRKWMSLHHRHLIKVYDVSLEPPAVFKLMEYASGGSLQEVLSARKSDLPLEILKDWCFQIAEGMAYLHANNIVHRDLKSPNIVIMEANASSNPSNKTLKITDFDQIREFDVTKTMTNAGTCAWAAPEVLTKGIFSKASDVWSFGVVQWEILTRNIPYKDVPDHIIIAYALKGEMKLEIPNSCPDIIRDILNECLSNDKEKRPSFYNILHELQRLLSASGEDLRTTGLEKMEKSPSKSFGHRIKKFFRNGKKTYLPQDFYGTVKKYSAIISDNRNYLLDNIQSNDELVALLLSFNCITEKQSHFIQLKRSIRHRNTELLSAMRSYDGTKLSNFVRCLRLTNQRTVARIMENGGGVIKVQVQNRVSKYTATIDTKLLHQKIEDFRNRTAPWSHQTDKVISQLRDEGIEILNSQLDRQTVVVWIWCHSQAAIEHIQKLYKSNELIDMFLRFANIRLSASENIQPRVINIDWNQIKKPFVVSSIFVNFTKSIANESALGITKLRNEIYVACRSESFDPHVIRVYEDRNPFLPKREIIKEEIGFPWGIGSSEKDNCLYVSDYFKKCIWKITREAHDEHKIIKWLTTDYQPYTLSVSSNGHLLLRDGSILMIYGSDAELVRSIQLTREIVDPIHAVETSIGNFVILHTLKEEEDEREYGSSWRNRGVRWLVSELSSDGQMVVRRFIPSDETQELKYPTYLSLDSDDQVFVAETWNGRVILLDSDLKWNRILCPTEEEEEETSIESPETFYYDEENKQLIVGGDDSGGINVYSFSRK